MLRFLRDYHHINHGYADDEYLDNADGYVSLVCVCVYEYALMPFLLMIHGYADDARQLFVDGIYCTIRKQSSRI